MKGIFLRFYMHENHKHHHVLLHQWLIEQARKQGIHGGTVFRGVAGFGHHGKLHFQHFYELAVELTMQIDFVVSEPEAENLIDLVRREKIPLFYLKVPAEFGVINPDPSDLAESTSGTTA